MKTECIRVVDASWRQMYDWRPSCGRFRCLNQLRMQAGGGDSLRDRLGLPVCAEVTEAASGGVAPDI